MIKVLLSGAAAVALLTSHAAVASAAARPEAPAWVIAPGTDRCRTEIELTGISGAVAPAAFVSDGQEVDLVFTKAGAPEQAFLPIRVDHKPFPNLVMRQTGGKTATMQLSDETLTALRKGGVLQIGWLTDEPVQIGLAGSDQALADLRTCGAQVAQRFHDQQAAQAEAKARAAADARAQALADEQLATVKAQKAAAQAEARRSAAEAERLRVAAEYDRQRAQREAEDDSYPYARVRDYPAADPRDAYYPPDPYYQSYQPQVVYRRW